MLSSAVELNETTTSSNFTMSSSGHSRLSLDSLQDENDEDSSRSLSTALYFEHLQPTPIVNGFGRRSHRFSTGDLSSSTSTSSRPFQRQLSAVEMQSEFMRASSSSASSIGVPSALIRSNTLPTGVPYFCTDIKRFQGGSTPLYTGTYKDMFPSNETISSIDGTEDG